jgi:hypothetical protein
MATTRLRRLALSDDGAPVSRYLINPWIVYPSRKLISLFPARGITVSWQFHSARVTGLKSLRASWLLRWHECRLFSRPLFLHYSSEMRYSTISDSNNCDQHSCSWPQTVLAPFGRNCTGYLAIQRLGFCI